MFQSKVFLARDLFSRLARTSVASWLTAVLTIGLGVARTAPADAPAGGDRIPTANGDLVIRPIDHATFVMGWNGKTIYVDPVGGGKRFESFSRPDLILITDIHGDHLNTETLSAVAGDKTLVVAPSAVAEKLPENLRKQTTVLANGETKSLHEIKIEAVPMYNLTQDRLKFHNKGRGNGYVLTVGGNAFTLAAILRTSPKCARSRISTSPSSA